MRGGKRTAGPGKKIGRPPIEKPKKRFSTRLAHEAITFLDERKRDGFKKAVTIENALRYYKAILTKELRK